MQKIVRGWHRKLSNSTANEFIADCHVIVTSCVLISSSKSNLFSSCICIKSNFTVQRQRGRICSSRPAFALDLLCSKPSSPPKTLCFNLFSSKTQSYREWLTSTFPHFARVASFRFNFSLVRCVTSLLIRHFRSIELRLCKSLINLSIKCRIKKTPVKVFNWIRYRFKIDWITWLRQAVSTSCFN